jgi:DNA-binding transcriptional ArsR family regulator
LPFHPNAFLQLKRNVKAGLVARTKILNVLETSSRSACDVCRESGLSYACVTYHLKSLKTEKLVSRSGAKRPFMWVLTNLGQQKLF